MTLEGILITLQWLINNYFEDGQTERIISRWVSKIKEGLGEFLGVF